MRRSNFRSGKWQVSATRIIGSSLVLARRRLRAFRAATGAATAVEFAMLSPIFIAPLLAALQIGVIYLAKSELDQAANAVSRAVMTGQATTSSQVSTAFCGALTALIDCNSVMVNLATYNSLASMQTANPVLTFDAHGNVSNNWSQTFAGSGAIMVMQVVYQYPVVGYGMLQLSSQSNGMLPLVSTAVFVME